MDIIGDLDKIEKTLVKDMSKLSIESSNTQKILVTGVGRLMAATEGYTQKNESSIKDSLDYDLSLEKIDWGKVKDNLVRLFQIVIKAIKDAFEWLVKKANNLYKVLMKYLFTIDKAYGKISIKRKVLLKTLQDLSSPSGKDSLMSRLPILSDYLQANIDFIDQLSLFFIGEKSTIISDKVILRVLKNADFQGLILSDDNEHLVKPNAIWDAKKLGDLDIGVYYQSVYDMGSLLKDQVDAMLSGRNDGLSDETMSKLAAFTESLETKNTSIMEDFIALDSNNKPSELKFTIPHATRLVLKDYHVNHLKTMEEVEDAKDHYQEVMNEEDLYGYAEEIKDILKYLEDDDSLKAIYSDPELNGHVIRYLRIAGFASTDLTTTISKRRISEAKRMVSHHKAMLTVLDKSYSFIEDLLDGKKPAINLIK